MNILIRVLLTGITAGVLGVIFTNLVPVNGLLEDIGMIVIIILSIYLFASKGRNKV